MSRDSCVSGITVMLVSCDILACASVVDRVLFAGILLFLWVGWAFYFSQLPCAYFALFCEVPFPKLPRSSENLSRGQLSHMCDVQLPI